jgi:cytochrome c556
VSDFDSLREDIERAFAASTDRHDAVVRLIQEHGRAIAKCWDEQAELRDDIYAVANRLEKLTAFVTSNPAEVAAAIVTDANRQTLREVRDAE